MIVKWGVLTENRGAKQTEPPPNATPEVYMRTAPPTPAKPFLSLWTVVGPRRQCQA